MKKIYYILLFKLILISCDEKKEQITLPFMKDTLISDLNGIYYGSSPLFFPYICKLDSSENIDLALIQIKYADRCDVLYKLQEPILTNYYLHKEIYRITVIRPYQKPFCIRIEKSNDQVKLFIKRLNRYYTSFSTFLTYDAHVEKPTNISLELDSQIIIPQCTWDSIEALINKTEFWKSNPRFDFDHPQNNSSWIFEGHKKSGYQVKVIPHPIFNNKVLLFKTNKYDKGDRYADLFEFIFQVAKFTDEKLY